MAKKGTRRRRRTRVIKGNVDEELTLGALANDTVFSESFDNVCAEKMFALSIEAVYSRHSIALTEGPIVFGVAHNDYSAAEIEEFIEATGSWDTGDLIAQEINRRKIRIVGVFDGEDAEEKFADGKSVKTPLKWMLNSTDTLRFWAYQKSGAPLTDGCILNANGHVWLKPG